MQVAGWHRQDRAGARVGDPGAAAMADPGERGGRHGRGLGDVGLLGDPGGQRAGLAVVADRALQVERHAAGRRGGHRPQRVADEEDHRAEQGDGGGEDQGLRGGLRRAAAHPREPSRSAALTIASGAIRPSARRTWRCQRAATPRSWVAIASAKPKRSRSASSRSRTRSAVSESRWPVGSSQSSSSGDCARALASATRCASPPESSAGSASPLASRPTSRSSSAGSCRGGRPARSATQAAKATFSKALKSAAGWSPAGRRRCPPPASCPGRQRRARRAARPSRAPRPRSGRGGRRAGAGASSCRSRTGPGARRSPPPRWRGRPPPGPAPRPRRGGRRPRRRGRPRAVRPRRSRRSSHRPVAQFDDLVGGAGDDLGVGDDDDGAAVFGSAAAAAR